MGIRDKRATNLRDRFVKNDSAKKAKKSNDKRFLNYYDLDFGEKMTIRLLPDGGDSGEIYLEYATHGPNLKTRGIEGVSCAYTSSGEDCPACMKSFDFYSDGNKKEAQRWRKKETFIAQCLVMDSPIEINESEDGNPVKLMYLPWGMLEQIREAIIEGQVEDPMDVDFVVKKTKNSGGFADYSKSYFARDVTPLDDEILDAFDEGVMALYDLSEELPKPSTTEEVETWLVKAESVVNKASRRNSNDDSGDTDDDDDDKDEDDSDEAEEKSAPTKKTSAKSLMEKLKKKNAK